jgi:hypothetical protein
MTRNLLALADDVFLMAHKEFSARPRLTIPVMGLASAGGLIGELFLARKVGIDVHTRELVVHDPTPPACPLLHSVLHQLIASPEHTAIRVWLEFLALTATEKVADRLVATNVVRRKRSWSGRTCLYPAIEPNENAHLQARISLSGVRGEKLDAQDAALLGIGYATGLDKFLLQDVSHANDYRDAILRALEPGMRCLISELRAAVAAVALNPSR